MIDRLKDLIAKNFSNKNIENKGPNDLDNIIFKLQKQIKLLKKKLKNG